MLPLIVLWGQINKTYTPEALLEILGRTDVSPDMHKFNSTFKFAESIKDDQIMTKKKRKFWTSTGIYLFFTEDKEFGENLHLVEEIHFVMNYKGLVNSNIDISKGFLGIEPGMKKKDVEAILATLDSDFKPSKTTVSRIKYQGNKEILCYFTSVKSKGVLEAITIPSTLNSLVYSLKDNFKQFGLSEIVPEKVVERYETFNKDFYYINAIPKQGCKSCIYLASNPKVNLTDEKRFEGQLMGLPLKGKLTITIDREPYYYTGEFLYGEANGKGLLIFSDSSVIIGYWKNGLLYKTDRMDLDGLYYIGEVMPDFKMHGAGKTKTQYASSWVTISYNHGVQQQ